MLHLFIKSALSGIIIMVISEVAKRSPSLGALIASLPLVSILGMIWLWHDTKDVERLAAYAGSTFWLVIPSLPMFLVLPVLLRHGLSLYPALGLSCVMTISLYLITIWVLGRFGMTF